MKKYTQIVFFAVFCLILVLSIGGINEKRYDTNFDQAQNLTHMENLADDALAATAMLLLLANVLLKYFRMKKHDGEKTVLAICGIVLGLGFTASVTFCCYYLLQYAAVLAGVIDLHMIGAVTDSNGAIVAVVVLAALAVTALTGCLAARWFGIEYRDLIRGFAYVHAFSGVVLSFALPDAGCLFIFSGVMLLINELLITLHKDPVIAYLWRKKVRSGPVKGALIMFSLRQPARAQRKCEFEGEAEPWQAAI